MPDDQPISHSRPANALTSEVTGFRLERTYAALPKLLFAEVQADEFPDPRVYLLNHQLASDLGLTLANVPDFECGRLLTGQVLADGSRPIAQAYAGHQYGGFTILGDGRALLLGEHRKQDGALIDIQLKGSGMTPYSRGGDGRAALGPMLREYLISEAMWHLNIPTTRSLAVATTGETVYRDKPARGAVLTRTAPSHIRVGTFQFAAARRDLKALRALADYTITRHYPDIQNHADPYLEFFRQAAQRQAALIARWQSVGFVHGVMNTDNMAVAGFTIDYGPCAFMNHYHPDTVFSSIDRHGRYCFANQPAIAQWNLVRLAEALLPLIHTEQQKAVEIVTAEISLLPDMFDQAALNLTRQKLGLTSQQVDDQALSRDLLTLMQNLRLDYVNTFRDLPSSRVHHEAHYQEPAFKEWYQRWTERLALDSLTPATAQKAMNQVNPAVIARNHRVEEALRAAQTSDDLAPFKRLLAALSEPFTDHEEFLDLRQPPPDGGEIYKTFCGT